MESWSLLFEVVLLLGACLILGGLFSLLRQSPLVGYLLAGMLLGGPGSLHIVQSEANIEAIAELGVSLLLFSLGLEFSWTQLRNFGPRLLLAGVAQVALTGLAAAVAAWGFGFEPRGALAIGALVSLSSTSAVLRVLVDRGDLESIHGRNALAVLLVQDMAVVPLTLLLVILSVGGSVPEVTGQLARIIGATAALVAVLYLVLNVVAVRLLRMMSTEQNRELAMLLAVVAGLGATWGAQAAGLSPAVGAFLAGVFLGGSPFAMQIRADVSPMQIVLLTLFFGSVGMVADPVWIVRNAGTVLGLAALFVVGKTLIAGGIFRLLGQPRGGSLATGLCLAQIGEFSFVLGQVARDHGVLSEAAYTHFVSSALLTLALTPYLVGWAPAAALRIERWRRRGVAAEGARVSAGLPPEIVIVGFGPAGQSVARTLVGSGRRVLAIDLNPRGVEAAEAMGLNALIGDATQLDVLHHARLRSAKLVVITVPARSAALTVLNLVRLLAPTAHLVVRSRYQLHKAEFLEAGADCVAGDEEQVGLGMSAYVEKQIAEWGPPEAARGTPDGGEAGVVEDAVAERDAAEGSTNEVVKREEVRGPGD